MRVFLVMMLSFISAIALAYDGAFSNKDFSSICAGPVISDDGMVLACTKEKGYSKVAKAKVGSNVSRLPRAIQRLDPIFGFDVLPDADTNVIYSYNRELLNRQNEVVGYLVIDGLVNSEMEVKVQIKHRYNLLGNLVSASVE